MVGIVGCLWYILFQHVILGGSESMRRCNRC
jgi:hypothetical protein